MSRVRVLICGICGKMGQEVAKAVSKEDDMEVVAGVDLANDGIDIREVAGIGHLGVNVTSDLSAAIDESKPDVMVDFTNPKVVLSNLKVAISKKVHCVVGTTGFSEADIDEVRRLSEANGVNVLIAPNFAIGAVLMMKFAATAARFLPNVEIIELHHNQKMDAPSGTSIKTAELIIKERKEAASTPINEMEKIKGARGGEFEGIRIHSVRLPGLVAHQEVIFGDQGQTLTIRHDSINRESFMPGVVLSIRRIKEIKGVLYGLEGLLNL
jgi:4-hydroxy-tetrahydrodipicolinate reductase